MRVAFLIMGIASFVGLVAMVVTGLEKVHTGHGLNTFRTTWLVEFNWVGFLVLVASIVIALVGAAVLRYLEWREVRQLQDRHEGER
jgi:hypothetical protein